MRRLRRLLTALTSFCIAKRSKQEKTLFTGKEVKQEKRNFAVCGGVAAYLRHLLLFCGQKRSKQEKTFFARKDERQEKRNFAASCGTYSTAIVGFIYTRFLRARSRTYATLRRGVERRGVLCKKHIAPADHMKHRQWVSVARGSAPASVRATYDRIPLAPKTPPGRAGITFPP